MRSRASIAFEFRLRATPIDLEERPAARNAKSLHSSSAVQGLFKFVAKCNAQLAQNTVND
jgi:hypothetical protein